MRVRPSPKQDAFVFDDSGVLLYRGAIASGKSVAGAIRSIHRRLKYPGTTQIIGGPSWDQLRDGTMRTLRRLVHESWIAYENKVEHHWVLKNGSEFIFRTLADPDVLRALEAHDMWVDENAMCGPEVLDVGLGRLRLPCADPTFRHSWWGTTTPRATDWTLDVFGEAGKPGYGVVHSTIYDNRANLPEGYIERLEDKYRDTPFFEQELLGLYTAFEGLVYPMFRREKHVKSDPWMLHDSESISIGVDFGGTADPSAMVLIGTRNNRLHQFDEFYKVGATLGEMLARLEEWTHQAKRQRQSVMVTCDPSGTVLTTTISAAKYAALPAERDKQAGLKLVAQRLNGVAGTPQLTMSPRCVYTITEYGQYVWSKKKQGETGIVYFTKVPIDHHGDAMDAVRYSVLRLGQARSVANVKMAGGLVIRGR